MNKQRSEAASIKKIKLFIIAVIAGFLAPVLVLILLIQYVQTFSRTGAGSATMSDAAIVQRLRHPWERLKRAPRWLRLRKRQRNHTAVQARIQSKRAKRCTSRFVKRAMRAA